MKKLAHLGHGIACDNGILVDEYCQTNIPEIFATGDCTNHPSARYGRRVRLESVDNAFEQARAAASTIAGKPLAHDKLPWFWSDQYDLKLLIVGLSAGHDQVVIRCDPEAAGLPPCPVPIMAEREMAREAEEARRQEEEIQRAQAERLRLEKENAELRARLER